MREGNAIDDLHSLGISPRTISALWEAGIFTLDRLRTMTRRELQRLPGINAKDVARLSSYLC